MEHTINQQQMDSLKALSETNIKISDAKNLLFKLQETETEYLIEREEKALNVIKKVIAESKAMLEEANENYSQIQEFSKELSAFAKNLLQLDESLQKALADFDERNTYWSKEMDEQLASIAETRNQLKLEKHQIENDRKVIESNRLRQSEEQRKIDSDRGTIERTVKRLKEKKI